MSSARKNPITDGWVIMAQDQAMREPQYEPVRIEPLAEGQVCPFCPGHEALTPEAIEAGNGAQGRAWNWRLIPNKFPTLSLRGELNRTGEGLYDLMNGIGAHEILIEAPDHCLGMSDFSTDHVRDLLGILRNRMLTLFEDDRFRSIQVFRNYGQAAGAAIDHPHTQIVALPMVPHHLRNELDQARHYFGYKERCVFCDMIDQEIKDPVRLVAENESFLLFVPFAARFPFEMWLIPKDHSHDFAEATDGDLARMAPLLSQSVRALRSALNNPPFNFYIHSAPHLAKPAEDQKLRAAYHWHLEIIPRLTSLTGFEWATGVYVNPTLPEQAATFLRRRLSTPDAPTD